MSAYLRKTFRTTYFALRNNLTALGMLALICGVILPLFSASVISGKNVGFIETNMIMQIISFFLAPVCGLAIPCVLFSYIHKRRDSDFFNSMPVKRSQYFIGYTVFAFAAFIGAYLLMCLLEFFVFLLNGVAFSDAGVAFRYFLPSLVSFFIVFSSTMLAITFTGSSVSTLVTLLLLNLTPVAVIYLTIMMGTNLYTQVYFKYFENITLMLTPVASTYLSIVSEGKGLFLLLQAGIAVLELAAAYLMFRFRRGETTMAVAFPKTRYIFQYLVMFLCSYVAVYFMVSNMLYWIYNNQYFPSTEMIMTGIVILASFIIMNMILERSMRAAFHKIRHLFIFTAGFTVLVFVITQTVNLLPRYVVPVQTDALYVEVNMRTFSPVKDEVGTTYLELTETHQHSYAVTDREKVKGMLDWFVSKKVGEEGGYIGETYIKFPEDYDIKTDDGYIEYNVLITMLDMKPSGEWTKGEFTPDMLYDTYIDMTTLYDADMVQMLEDEYKSFDIKDSHQTVTY